MAKDKLRSFLKAALLELDADEDELGYDDYEENNSILFTPNPVQPLYLSDKALKVISLFGTNFNEVFNNCSIYIYGYDDKDIMEKTLAKNLNIGGHPFNNIAINVIEIGKAERFEIISNKDSFIYFGGGIGTHTNAPMHTANIMLNKENTLNVSMNVTFN